VIGDDGAGRKIFLGNLSFQSDERYIRDHFEKFGGIEDICIPTDERGQKRGFGFVTFEKASAAEDAAAAMNQQMFDGRCVTCNIARPRPAGGGPPRERGQRESGWRGGGGYDRGGRGRDDRGGRDYDRGGGRDYDRGGGRDYDRDRRRSRSRDYDRGGRGRDYDRRDRY